MNRCNTTTTSICLIYLKHTHYITLIGNVLFFKLCDVKALCVDDNDRPLCVKNHDKLDMGSM